MQRAYISKLLEIAQRDENVLHLLADSGTGYDELFRHNFEGRMLNLGIAEENMVGVAAGLAIAGKEPYVYTAGAFLSYRAFEFIRDDVCFQNLNVKIVGMGSGLAWCSLGPSHHTTEDVSVLRAIPNLTILSPATPVQVAMCTELAHEIKGPVYMKIGMNNEPEFYGENYQLPENGQDVLRQGEQIAIFVTGSILEEVMEAANLLEEVGISATVVNVAVLKPFSEKVLSQLCNDVNMIFTVEEHNVLGGLGGIVAEILSEKKNSPRLRRIGLNNEFAKGYASTQKELRKINGLDAISVAEKIKEAYYE